MIVRKVSDRCSNSEMRIWKALGDYEQALCNCAYQKTLEYQDTAKTMRKGPRYKNIFWYNPPFSRAIKTNLGKEFLKLVEKHFPPSSQWHRHFNKHTLKLSYSTTKNIASIIGCHNKKVLRGPEGTQACNCRTKDNCPLDGACLTRGVVYLSTIKTSSQNYGYWGSTANIFK